ncbi:uncharacterized protein MEPE_04358 [Melanopsichium pennsylvanicum]|uniref:DUF1168-domain-containing protein n=2 Tax=Melanopsichium pennsylvanicum TaxID=63383 RepID=A0AAJ5C6M7_9BASI|nr:conserved hypothetical protein [Melanopsichium pennsylvanicum 4]SNX85649.1 uncharacterized protein MEPE_04358 [Melanopsichium pennsylvanicum]
MSYSLQKAEASSSPSRSTSDLTGSPPAGKKGKLSPHEKQAQAISKLLANPDKEICIPDCPKEKSIRPPRDVMKNVTGSSAGAGSGEFHVYKQQRRREYERIQLMEEQNRKLTEQEEFEKNRAEVQRKDEAKTDKNRAKREKKKLAALKAQAAATGKSPSKVSAATASRNGEPEAKKQRLHNDAVNRIEFKPKDDSGDDDDAKHKDS